MVSYISLIFYILAFVHIALFLYSGSRNVRNLFNIFMMLGLLSNLYELIIRFMETGLAPTSTLYDLMLSLSLSFGITYFILYAKYRRPLIGLFISPFMAAALVIAIFYPPTITPSYPVVDSIWKVVHLPFIVLGTTFLVAAFVASVMYILQEAQLKKKKFGFIFQRFPALDTIGKINNTSLTIGFYFFTIGAVLGFIWMLQNNLEQLLSSAKVVFSVLTWFLYAALIIFRRIKPLTQRQTAQWTIIGFVLIIITYIGVASFMLR